MVEDPVPMDKSDNQDDSDGTDGPARRLDRPSTRVVDLLQAPKVISGARCELAPPQTTLARLFSNRPDVQGLGDIKLHVTTQGWRFPTLPNTIPAPGLPVNPVVGPRVRLARTNRTTRVRPSPESVAIWERLLYLLQPALETVFSGSQLPLALQPYPYQLEGIAFLMARSAALLADEMGLGKTAQAILAMRLLFHAGLARRALVVCPKPLVTNWTHELGRWAEDLPYEVVAGDSDQRRSIWLVSNCPLKIVNYEILTRDAELATRQDFTFDLVVLDEAQRIKNRSSKAATVVRSIRRHRSWALTGTPVENRSDDLVGIFAFVDPDRVPADTPAKRLAPLTADCILRRRKEDVLGDLPERIEREAHVELTPAQRQAYDRAEREGVICLNALGDTITVHHVFELIMRLKQICNFDPLTGQSAKLEQLRADLAEVCASGRKAIIFSQWVDPLRFLAVRIGDTGPLQYHGQVAERQRQAVLEEFRTDPGKHVLLMTYGTGGVGLNLQFANYVFLFDRWWNPAVEDQAIGRVHRLGQQEPVFVTRFLTPDTIESRIAAILEKKRELFRDLIEERERPASMGLTEAEIFGLFDLRFRPRRAAA